MFGGCGIRSGLAGQGGLAWSSRPCGSLLVVGVSGSFSVFRFNPEPMSVSIFVIPCCLREFHLSLEVVALGCL